MERKKTAAVSAVGLLILACAGFGAAKYRSFKGDACCPEHGKTADMPGGVSSEFELPPGHPQVDLSKPVQAPPLTEKQLQTGAASCPHEKDFHGSQMHREMPDSKSLGSANQKGES